MDEPQKIDLGKCRHDHPEAVCWMCCLHEACDGGNIKAVTDLLAAGADANHFMSRCAAARYYYSHAPIHEVARYNSEFVSRHGGCTEEESVRMLELLMNHGAQINLPTRCGNSVGGQTALHLAVIHGNLLMAESLIKSGADVTAGDEDGNTPLHVVAISGNNKCDNHRLQVAEVLLRNGATKEIRNRQDQTPLDCARNESHADLKLLMEGKQRHTERRHSAEGSAMKSGGEGCEPATTRPWWKFW